MTLFHATSEGNIPFTAEEIANLTAEQAVWDAGANDRKAAEVRKERNAKIAACDWRVLPDVLNGDVWKVYRQALRDVPMQAGFPGSVVWPVEPTKEQILAEVQGLLAKIEALA